MIINNNNNNFITVSKMFSWGGKSPLLIVDPYLKKKLKHNYNYHKKEKKLCYKKTIYMSIIKIHWDGKCIVHRSSEEKIILT